LIRQTSVFAAGTQSYLYFKIPITPDVSTNVKSHVEFNFKVEGSLNSVFTFSLFKVNIQIYSVPNPANFICNIDNTHNPIKLVINKDYKVVYYTDAESVKHYYLKLKFVNTEQKILTYLDISANSYIPEDFSTNDLIVTSLPSSESNAPYSIYIVNPYTNAVLNSGNNYWIAVITNGTDNNNPAVTHPYIYGGTDGANWSYAGSVITGYGIWMYNYTS
jgi:hypothetical protein